MQRIAAYIRVSTDEQADNGNSLSEQQERLSAYCKAMGWSQPTFYIDDGYSAKNLNRPAIQRLLKDVQQRKIDVILTAKLDRFCRNLLDLLQTVDMLDEFKCNFVSASESFDTSTAVGRMVLQLLGVFAEFERERISERVKDNMLSIAKHTNKAITQPCYGYDIVDGQYVINEQEAEYVRLMFDLAEQGHGHRMIAKILNERGAKTKRGKMWDQVNVKRLMQTETIAGIMVYNKRDSRNGKVVERDKSEWIIKENNHPAIIPPERFERVQEIFRSRSRARKHADNETYLLTGLVKCKHCGKNMKGSTSRHKTKYNEYTYYRYICSSYVLGYGCKHHAVHRDDYVNFYLHLFEPKVTDAEKFDLLSRFKALMSDRYWLYARAAIISTRYYREGLEFVDRLTELNERFRQSSELTKEEYERIDRYLIEFRLQLYDKLDWWPEYIEYFDKMREEKSYTKRYILQKQGVDDYLLRIDERFKYVHFLYGQSHRYELIKKKLKRLREGKKVGNLYHHSQFELPEEEVRARFEFILNCAEKGLPVFEPK